jgi:hypothetical protein
MWHRNHQQWDLSFVRVARQKIPKLLKNATSAACD